ncbi:MAG: hypothetical protein GX316_00690 [Firmicutes bacterium]|nr:hypothetical protein [Bacillota bacterium]
MRRRQVARFGTSRSVWRYRLRQRLPLKLFRNLGVFYLFLALSTGFLVLWLQKPEYLKFKFLSLPKLMPLDGDLPRNILEEGLPISMRPVSVHANSSENPEKALRSIVHVVTDYDLAEPESVLKAAFPGSRSDSNALGWEWFLTRSIQGYDLGVITAIGSSLEKAKDSLVDGVLRYESASMPDPQAEVVITAPGYGISVPGDTGLDDNQDVSVQVIEAVERSESLLGAAERLESLARIDWGTQPLIGIYHTHTGETYAGAGINSKKSYAWDVAKPGQGADPGVVQVGERITRELFRRYGIPVIHSTKIHDFPVFAYAYSNSEKTAKMLVERYPSIQLVLDIHRDEGATLETFGGRQLAGVLIVVAGGSATLDHPNWRTNLAAAQQLKDDFDRMYPGLCRGLIVKENVRYNQHLHPGALLLEIGAHTDTLDSALMTAELVADVLAETLWQLQSGRPNRSVPARPGPGGVPSPLEIFEPKNLRPALGL